MTFLNCSFRTINCHLGGEECVDQRISKKWNYTGKILIAPQYIQIEIVKAVFYHGKSKIVNPLEVLMNLISKDLRIKYYIKTKYV